MPRICPTRRCITRCVSRCATECWLVQTEDYARAEELFSADYHFSSTSSSWLDHAAGYARTITGDSSWARQLCHRGGGQRWLSAENFVAAGIPCLGIEPTASTAAAAEALGIPVMREFLGEALGRRLAGEGRSADLIAGNNVFAHVPDINDFTRGLAAF